VIRDADCIPTASAERPDRSSTTRSPLPTCVDETGGLATTARVGQAKKGRARPSPPGGFQAGNNSKRLVIYSGQASHVNSLAPSSRIFSQSQSNHSIKGVNFGDILMRSACLARKRRFDEGFW
jgi:hypothetical protein